MTAWREHTIISKVGKLVQTVFPVGAMIDSDFAVFSLEGGNTFICMQRGTRAVQVVCMAAGERSVDLIMSGLARYSVVGAFGHVGSGGYNERDKETEG